MRWPRVVARWPWPLRSNRRSWAATFAIMWGVGWSTREFFLVKGMFGTGWGVVAFLLTVLISGFLLGILGVLPVRMPRRRRRYTRDAQTLRAIAAVFVQSPRERWYVRGLQGQTGLSGRRIRTMLRLLVAADWVAEEWDGTLTRRYYQVTGAGIGLLNAIVHLGD